MSSVERLLRQHLGPEQLRRHGIDAGMSVVLITPRFPQSRHVVAMVHPSRSVRPSLVAKLPRRPGDTSGVRREADVLTRLAAVRRREHLGVPEVVGLFEDGVQTALVETALQGRPLDPVMVQRDFDAALAAGLEFVSALPVTAGSREGRWWFESVVEPTLHRFAQLVPLDGDTGRLVDRTLAFLQPLRAARLPAVLTHGDLSHPNLFLTDSGRLEVIDWERATSAGLPGQDLVFFLAYLAESRRSAYTRPDQVRVFDETFVGAGAWGRRVLLDHLRLRDVDTDLLSEVVVATWALSGATLLERLVPDPDLVGAEAAAAVAPSPAELRAVVEQDRDVALWRHAMDVADRLADGPIS